MLSSGKKKKTVVGLDVEAGSVAATEVTENGSIGITRFGTVGLGSGVFREGEVSDPDALGQAFKELFAQKKLSKTVRLGIASQRVAVRTIPIPVIEDQKELDTAIRFQAQDHIPMPLDQAVLDWQVVGRSMSDNGEATLNVVVVAARRESLHGLITAMRQAGLRPVGIDLSAFAMIRALAGKTHAAVGTSSYVDAPGASAEQQRIAGHLAGDGSAGQASSSEDDEAERSDEVVRLYCNLGDVTNLAVARGRACLFTRVSPFGIEGIAQKLAERRRLNLEHARQWLVHVGLETPAESVEGDPELVSAARESLAEGAIRLVDELRLSLNYYGAQEGALPVEGVVACGPGTTIPGLTERLQRELGQRFEVARPQALAHLDDPTAARLTVSLGLGMEQ